MCRFSEGFGQNLVFPDRHVLRGEVVTGAFVVPLGSQTLGLGVVQVLGAGTASQESFCCRAWT